MTIGARTSLAFALGLGVFAAACADNTQRPPPRPPANPGMPPHHVPPPPGAINPRPPRPPGPAEMRVDYKCDNGEQVAVRFFPQQGIGVLVRGGQNVELQGQSTPPGFTYSNGQTTLRVAPDRLTMTMNVGMMATAKCMAR